ncbi:hypothetical protein LINPERHAP2_LOCUS33466 [Linum perenne]
MVAFRIGSLLIEVIFNWFSLWRRFHVLTDFGCSLGVFLSAEGVLSWLSIGGSINPACGIDDDLELGFSGGFNARTFRSGFQHKGSLSYGPDFLYRRKQLVINGSRIWMVHDYLALRYFDVDLLAEFVFDWRLYLEFRLRVSVQPLIRIRS